ncbi:hypothetical protein C8F01DRAFT_634742 [Mycena amicta]|nr:hypothetical protein C8F01DRAFT_634742 [Mycena amicta]
MVPSIRFHVRYQTAEGSREGTEDYGGIADGGERLVLDSAGLGDMMVESKSHQMVTVTRLLATSTVFSITWLHVCNAVDKSFFRGSCLPPAVTEASNQAWTSSARCSLRRIRSLASSCAGLEQEREFSFLRLGRKRVSSFIPRSSNPLGMRIGLRTHFILPSASPIPSLHLSSPPLDVGSIRGPHWVLRERNARPQGGGSVDRWPLLSLSPLRLLGCGCLPPPLPGHAATINTRTCPDPIRSHAILPTIRTVTVAFCTPIFRTTYCTFTAFPGSFRISGCRAT